MLRDDWSMRALDYVAVRCRSFSTSDASAITIVLVSHSRAVLVRIVPASRIFARRA